MARRYARKRSEKHISENTEPPVSAELSLDEILEEFRAQQAEEAAREAARLAAEREEARRIEMQPEDGGVETAGLPEEEPEPTLAFEDAPEPAAALSREPEAEPPAPAEEAQETPAPAERKTAPVPSELIEGYGEEDDFYAGPVEEPPADEDASPEESAEASDGEEEEKAEKKKPARPVRRKIPEHPLSGLWGRLVGLAAVASLRREQRREQPPPEPEDAEKEMEPRKAARHYAAQMPSLRLRAIGAALVCLLLAWITLSFGFGWPLPGGLEDKLRGAALVCLAGEITVMLLGLDVLTSGVMSLVRGRPGAESMIALAGLASLADTAAAVLSKSADRGLPYTAIPAFAVMFALWGAWYTGRGYYDSFMTFFHIKEPCCVSSVELSESDGRGLVTSKRDAKGFIRRSEEPGPAESMAGTAFFPMAVGALGLSAAAALGAGDPGSFFHIFALITGLCASFGWLFAWPLLFARTARHLMLGGAVIAGWNGTAEVGKSGRLVLCDRDVFPPDAVEITGVRILDKLGRDTVISYTGSLLATAGTGTAAVFTELMRRYNAALQQVDDFAVGEGGAKGLIGDREVRVGTLGFMHLSAVKIPDRLKADDALYAAVDGELAGVFQFRYRPLAEVQRALYTLRGARRRPIFAIRDFNIDPMQLHRTFGVSAEGFRFPTFPERYRLSGLTETEEGPVAGVIGFEGLEALVDLCESGVALYRFGRLCAWACLVSVLLGAALMLPACWLGNWGSVSAAKALLYMLLWVLPGAVSALMLRK